MNNSLGLILMCEVRVHPIWHVKKKPTWLQIRDLTLTEQDFRLDVSRFLFFEKKYQRKYPLAI